MASYPYTEHKKMKFSVIFTYSVLKFKGTALKLLHNNHSLPYKPNSLKPSEAFHMKRRQV